MKTQTIALTILSVALLLLGLHTCSRSVERRQHTSTTMRCRVNKVFEIDDYQKGKSVYPTQLRWVLHTDEGYRVVTHDNSFSVGDSIDINVIKFFK